MRTNAIVRTGESNGGTRISRIRSDETQVTRIHSDGTRITRISRIHFDGTRITPDLADSFARDADHPDLADPFAAESQFPLIPTSRLLQARTYPGADRLAARRYAAAPRAGAKNPSLRLESPGTLTVVRGSVDLVAACVKVRTHTAVKSAA